jgi:hypothetical protein
MMFNTGVKVIPCCGQAGIMDHTIAFMIHSDVIPFCGIGYNIGLSQGFIQILSSCVKLCKI